MATDPTRRIREQDFENVLVVHASKIAERLADIEPSPDIPMVTVTLDWQVEGTNPGRQPDERHPDFRDQPRRSEPDRAGEERGEDSARRRPSRRVFQDKMDEIVEAHGPHGDVYESLKGDFERISTYLDHEIDPSAQGAYIVSCSAKGIFETVLFALPLPTAVSTGPTPALTELVRLDEDFPTYAALLADQREATLSVIAHGTTDRSIYFEGSGYPRKQSQGGWSQRRFQARADERVEAFARDVAEETRKVMEEGQIESLVIAGDEVMVPALEKALHERVAGRVIGTVSLDIDAGEHEVVEKTLPIAVRHERENERVAVDRLNDGIGASTFGTGGSHGVIESLQAGQVQTLVMNADYEEPGWADFTMPAYGAGDLPANHPLGGEVGNLVSLNLHDEFVRLAVQTGADVEIVHTDIPDDQEDVEDIPDSGETLPRSKAANLLDEHGGVGAILRYVMDEGPTEEESAAQAKG